MHYLLRYMMGLVFERDYCNFSSSASSTYILFVWLIPIMAIWSFFFLSSVFVFSLLSFCLHFIVDVFFFFPLLILYITAFALLILSPVYRLAFFLFIAYCLSVWCMEEVGWWVLMFASFQVLWASLGLIGWREGGWECVGLYGARCV